MVILIALVGAIGGAIVGSFLATVILRWPRGERMPRGRSRCDHCQRALSILDLVPLMSALVTRGRCRTCRASIDPLHRNVELTCAAIGAVALTVRPDAAGMAVAVMGWLLVPLAWLDWRHQWLPDQLNVLLAFAGFGLGGLMGIPWPDRLMGAAIGFGALWLIATAYLRLRGREGLGGGDPKLLGAIGAWVGWVPIAPILTLAACIGLAIALTAKMRRDAALPFGTMLAPAAWLAALALAASA